MLAALAGDRVAYRSLLEHLRRRLEIFFGRKLRGMPAEVEDLVQETLLAIHAKRETFDRTQALTPWAYTIARYKLIDHLRRTRGRITIPLENAAEVFVEDGSAAVEARRD